MQHHITIPKPVAKFILRRGRWIVLAVSAITALMVWQIRHSPLSISALESFTSDFRTFEEYQRRADLFGGDSDMLVFIASDEGELLFTADKLNAIRAVARELEQMPEVQQVVALTDIALLSYSSRSLLEQALLDATRQSLLEGQPPPLVGALAVQPWWPSSESAQEKIDLQAVRQQFLEDRLVAGKLLSEDGNSHCMILRLNPELMGLAAKWRIRSQFTEVCQRHGLNTDRLYLSGLTISEGWILKELVACLRYQLPLGVLAIALIVFSMYRSLSVAGLTILVGAIGSVWAVAVTGFVFGKITILVAAVPLLILVISTSDTIHIVSAYGRELAKGWTREEALLAVIQDVGGACVLTSLTTLVGFLSLLLIPVTAIRHLAVTAGVGVALSLILAITLVPIGIRWMDFNPPDTRSRSNTLANALVAFLITACRLVSLKFPRIVVAVHVLALIVAAHYALAIDFDPNLTQRFHPKHPMPIGVEYFNQNFSGTNVIEIFVQGDPEQLLSPDTLKTLDEIRSDVMLIPEIKSVSGVNDLFAVVDRVIDYQTTSGLPPTQVAAQASLKMLEQVQPDLVRAAITPEGRQIKISAYTTFSGFFEVLELSERIRELFGRRMPDDLVVEVSGIMPVIAKSVETIVDSQLTGLTFCFTVVLLIVIVALRSFRLGLISLLPNVFPLLILAGCLGFGSTHIDSDYIIIFTIAFGIAVDDTIHFLHRYDVEFAHSGHRDLALERAYSYSGKAIVQTTVVLGVGLSPLALSNYLTIWMLGTYLVLTLALAVLADLLFLPALLLLFDHQGRDT